MSALCQRLSITFNTTTFWYPSNIISAMVDVIDLSAQQMSALYQSGHSQILFLEKTFALKK